MSEAIRAGVPSVAVPYSGEQSFWASRLYSLGAAPKPIPRLKLTTERLIKALNSAVAEAGLRQRVSTLSQKLNREDGIANAVAAFQSASERRPAGR